MADTRRELAADSWGSLLRVHAALVPALDAEMRRNSGLALAWYDVLLELYATPGHRLRISTLADKVTLSRPRVSRIVDELVVAGLVCRESNPDDGRSSLAALTPAGVRKFRQAAPPYLDAIESGFASNLDTAELRVLRDILRKIHTSGSTST